MAQRRKTIPVKKVAVQKNKTKIVIKQGTANDQFKAFAKTDRKMIARYI